MQVGLWDVYSDVRMVRWVPTSPIDFVFMNGLSAVNVGFNRAAKLGVGVTALFYLTAIQWDACRSVGLLLDALLSYGIAVGVASLPYLFLLPLLDSIDRFPRFQIACFAVVTCLPLFAFSFCWLSETRTDGWLYLLVPFWQLALELLLYMVVRLVCLSSKN